MSRQWVLFGDVARGWLFGAFWLNVIFVFSKSGALYFLLRDVNPSVRWIQVLRSFLKSVAASVVTFTGKAGFLTALFVNMGAHVEKTNLAAVLFRYTALNLSVFLSFLPLFLISVPIWQITWMLCLNLAAAIIFWAVYRKKSVVWVFVFVFLSYLANYFQIVVIARSLGASFSPDLFRAVIAADLARVVSHIPLGIGAFDGVFYALSNTSKAFPVSKLPVFFVLVRLFGECMTACWGLLILVFEGLRGHEH